MASSRSARFSTPVVFTVSLFTSCIQACALANTADLGAWLLVVMVVVVMALGVLVVVVVVLVLVVVVLVLVTGGGGDGGSGFDPVGAGVLAIFNMT